MYVKYGCLSKFGNGPPRSIDRSAERGMACSVLVPIANGSEEIETVCIVDTLVRAGATVTVASVEASATCKMSRGVVMVADALIADAVSKEYDCIAVPGGMPGAKTISESVVFIDCLKKHAAAGKTYGAICAAPAVVLQAHGLIPAGAAATCFPAFAEKLEAPSESRVVTTGKLVTSRGPGTSIEFALALIDQLMPKLDAAKAAAVPKQMLVAGY